MAGESPAGHGSDQVVGQSGQVVDGHAHGGDGPLGRRRALSPRKRADLQAQPELEPPGPQDDPAGLLGSLPGGVIEGVELAGDGPPSGLGAVPQVGRGRVRVEGVREPGRVAGGGGGGVDDREGLGEAEVTCITQVVPLRTIMPGIRGPRRPSPMVRFLAGPD